MSTHSISWIASIAAAALMLVGEPASAQKKKGPGIDLQGKTLAKTLEELLPSLGQADPAARAGAAEHWQRICSQAGAPGNEDLRAEVCTLMVGRLDAKTPDPARIVFLTQLAFLGRAEAVEPAAALLADKNEKVHDAALRCLANNPTPEANAKLLAALSGSAGKAKVGVLNALGFRADVRSVEKIAGELGSADASAVAAAARALGRIGNADAAKALASARTSAKGQGRLWIDDAYLICADRAAAAGKTAEAAAIYKALNGADEERSTRLAAYQGVLKTAGDAAGAMIVEALSGKDRDAQAIALTQIATASPKALDALAAQSDRLPTQARILLIGALATRGARAHKGIAFAAASSDDEGLKKAGILALGRLGDVAATSLLAEVALSKSKLADVAKESLATLTADGADEKLTAILKEEKTPAHAVALIQLLDQRRAATAVPTLVALASHADGGVRTASFVALGRLAEAKDVPGMLAGLVKTSKGGERDVAERAVLAVCVRTAEGEKQADPVLALLDSDNRVDLLPLLGRIGGAKVLAIVKREAASETPEIQDAAILALCNWPDFSVSEDLLRLAKDAKKPQNKQLAFRNLVRVNSMSNELPAPPRLAMLKQAMELARTKEERQYVLGGLATAKDIETLRFVTPYLDQKDLAQAACRTIVELAHSRNLREPNQAEFHKVLDRVIAMCQDQGLVERAKQYKAGE